jgi:Potential Queuosine, Q, salvage protein family
VLTDDVRRHCAAVAANARDVRIDLDAEIELGGVAGLDPELHFLDGPAGDVARYILILDAINFGSGWFGELGTSTDALTARLTAHGPWTEAELRSLDAREVGDALGLDPAHRLTELYAEALNQLGAFLPVELGDSAEELAQRLTAMPFFGDRGFYKRAQITANDLHLAGVVEYPDIERLTIFADNLVPHVLRLDGVLRYSDELARRIDAGIELPAGGRLEQEVRACAVHACEAVAARAGVPPATLDNWLWNRGQTAPYSERPAHITRTVYY